MKKILSTVALSAAMLFASSASAAPTKAKICVFDFIGESGPVMTRMKDFKLEALKWGTELELKSFTSEKIATEEFKQGRCDGVMFSGFRARQFVPFSGTIDAIGAMPDMKHLKKTISALASDKTASLMTNGDYETAGILPLGAAYVFVKDKNINTLSKAAGKRIAVLDYDETQRKMVNRVGASPVSVDLMSIGGKFNNNSVDIVIVPAIAYEPFELYKGLGENGGVIAQPVTQLTSQFIIRSDKFPADFGLKSRKFAATYFDKVTKIITDAKNGIPSKYWINIPQEDVLEYNALMKNARQQLRDEGYYDAKALKLMSKIRCSYDSSLTECTGS